MTQTIAVVANPKGNGKSKGAATVAQSAGMTVQEELNALRKETARLQQQVEEERAKAAKASLQRSVVGVRYNTEGEYKGLISIDGYGKPRAFRREALARFLDDIADFSKPLTKALLEAMVAVEKAGL